MLKSQWAYNNGKRIMQEAKESIKDKRESGFYDGKYYENVKGKICLKTYSNKTQANKKCDELIAKGFDCFVSFKWPFLILLNN